MHKSNPDSDRASRTGSESGGLSSENRVLVNALLGKSESMASQFPAVSHWVCSSYPVGSVNLDVSPLAKLGRLSSIGFSKLHFYSQVIENNINDPIFSPSFSFCTRNHGCRINS